MGAEMLPFFMKNDYILPMLDTNL